MSQDTLDKALFHLYVNIHKYDEYSPRLFGQFALSEEELDWLKTLFMTQRRGLLIFNNQLRHKQFRSIKHALPRSAAIFGDDLDILISNYASTQSEIGPREPEICVRLFSDYLERSAVPPEVYSRAFEFISYECLLVTIALSGSNRQRKASIQEIDCRKWFLPAKHYCRTASYSYDVLGTLHTQGDCHRKIPQVCLLLIFVDSNGRVRILKVSSHLFSFIRSMEEGRSVLEALRYMGDPKNEEVLFAAVQQLSSLGLPFQLDVALAHA
jgi:hypothetical protein